MHRRTRLVLVAAVLAGAGGPAAGTEAPLTYRLPVDGPVVARFEAPADAYGPGHRGVDLLAPPGAAVRAAAAGTVAFAGLVAGTRWVSVDHADGVRTSYGPLATTEVDAGAGVAAGDTLGTAAGDAHAPGDGRLHWGARRGDRYLDPLTLLRPPRTWRPALIGPGGWSLRPRDDLPSYEPWSGDHRWGFVPGSPVATGPGWSLPPNPNHVVAIAGLGSRTGEPALELTHLGFDPRDVTHASYAGVDVEGGPVRYGPEDTWRGVAAAASRLEDHLRHRWQVAPGQAVDLVGHSMGGVVALYYLLFLHDPADVGLPPIGHVVTIASPLEGADLASGIVAAREDPRLAALLALASAVVSDHDPWAPAIDELAVDSEVIAGVASRWEAARSDAAGGPLALGTRVLTTGAEFDPVVPEHRSDLPGAEHVVLPGGHDGVRSTEAVRQVVRAFLADAPVPGEAGGVGYLLSHPLGWIERVIPRLLAS